MDKEKTVPMEKEKYITPICEVIDFSSINGTIYTQMDLPVSNPTPTLDPGCDPSQGD